MILFGSTTTGNCTFEGCLEYIKKAVGDKWKYGRAFGWSCGRNAKSTWERYSGYLKPKQWYGICTVIDVSVNTFDLFIENEIYNFENSFDKSSFEENIQLFNKQGEEKNPFYGEITDLNVWSKIRSRSEINQFISCDKQGSGDFLSWKSVHLKLNGLDKIERPFSDVCRKDIEEPNVVYTNLVNSQEEHLRFCKSIGSLVATAKNEEQLENLLDTRISSIDHVFLGFIFDADALVDINNHSITTNWDSHKNYTPVGENPSCLVSDGSLIFGDSCNFALKPICKAKESFTDFQLRGVCLDSGADTRFIFINSTFLLGYLNSEMVFLTNKTQWIIRNSTSNMVLATLNKTSDFPIGKHRWHFTNGINCTDTNETHRTLFLHLDVTQPGHFCCDDGTCMDWQATVGDSVPQCPGGEDEDPCPGNKCGLNFINPGLGSFADQPNMQKKEINGVMTLVKTQVRANVTIIDVLSISETEGMFQLYFVVQLMWKDVLAKYVNLKDDENMNFFEEKDSKVIWTPSLGFFQWKPLETMDFGTRMLIQKNTDVQPVLSAGMDSVFFQEVYFGNDHFLKYITKQRAQFLCQFDKIKNYPHGYQECSMGFYIKGHSNNMTNLTADHLEAKENVVIGDYIVKFWRYEAETERESGEHRLKVTMTLVRKFQGIFLVTYFPSILMNVINQASNFISGDSR